MALTLGNSNNLFGGEYAFFFQELQIVLKTHYQINFILLNSSIILVISGFHQ